MFTPALCPPFNGVRLMKTDGGPHAISWTHADQLNRALLDFLA